MRTLLQRKMSHKCDAKAAREFRKRNSLFCAWKGGGRMYLADSVSKIKGIGEKTEKALQKLDVVTVGDLLSYYPRTYETYELPVPIGELKEGKIATIEASVVKSADVTRYRNLQVTWLYIRQTPFAVCSQIFDCVFNRLCIRLNFKSFLNRKHTYNDIQISWYQ
jgi:nucleotidyltransferase/DNA polymerase involved in DNA repair